MKIQSPKQTPYRRIINSKAGRTVRQNKVATGAGVVGATLVIAGGSVQSQAFANVARYGIVPAVGAGIGTLGATAVHDAVVNDWADSKGKAALKMGLGTAATLGGAQMIGLAYEIPVMDEALTGVLEKAVDNADVLAGAGLTVAGVKAGQFAFDKASKAINEESGKLGNGAMAAASAVGGLASTLGGVELIGRRYDIPVAKEALTGTMEFLANSPAATTVGGALLTGGAAIAATQGVKNAIEGGNEFGTAALGIGAVAGGLGGVEMMGNGLGLEATKGLLTENGFLVGGASVAGVGAAWATSASRRIVDNGLSGRRGLELAAGAAAVPAGVAVAAQGLESQLGIATKVADAAVNTSQVVGGVGLGLAAVGFGKQAVDAAKEGKFESTVFNGALSATSAAAGLGLIGEGMGIPQIQEAGRVIARNTIEPLAEHVLAPTAEFLFNNPIAGGVMLAVGVGGYLYYRSQDAKQ